MNWTFVLVTHDPCHQTGPLAHKLGQQHALSCGLLQQREVYSQDRNGSRQSSAFSEVFQLGKLIGHHGDGLSCSALACVCLIPDRQSMFDRQTQLGSDIDFCCGSSLDESAPSKIDHVVPPLLRKNLSVRHDEKSHSNRRRRTERRRSVGGLPANSVHAAP
jgi:hypothetical protein